MAYLVYNLCLAGLSPVLALYLAQRYVSGKSKPGWSERWGALPIDIGRRDPARRRVWVHAVSAGEVVAATPILRELRNELPEADIVFSVITPAGYDMARREALRYVNSIFYFPFDLPWVVRRVVHTIGTDLFVSLESDMWPNLLHELKRSGAQTMLVNGRITDASLKRIRRFGMPLFRWMTGNMDCLLMQSEADSRRMQELSPVSRQSNIAVFGNSKFDQDLPVTSPSERDALRASLGFGADSRIFIAGSTRSKEEEAIVLSAYSRMRAECPDLCLIVAPRKIDRAGELEEAMRGAGLQPVRKTRLVSSKIQVQHLILDTMGELASVYSIADITFVGNSFPPVVDGGGQNIVQPLAHGKPVIVGPYTATCRAEVTLATEARVAFRVMDEEELVEVGARLLNDPAARTAIEMRALELVRTNRGVSRRYAEAIASMLQHAPSGALAS
jgi:3-deoxy-D-manno-octulosonic-acid transferase